MCVQKDDRAAPDQRRAAGLPAGRREPRRVCLLVRHNYTIFYQSCQQKKNARSFRATFFVEIIQISLFFDNSDSANLRAHGYTAAGAETIAGAAGTRKRLRRKRRPKPARPSRGNDYAQGRQPAVFYPYTELIRKEAPARGRRKKRPRKGGVEIRRHLIGAHSTRPRAADSRPYGAFLQQRSERGRAFCAFEPFIRRCAGRTRKRRRFVYAFVRESLPPQKTDRDAAPRKKGDGNSIPFGIRERGAPLSRNVRTQHSSQSKSPNTAQSSRRKTPTQHNLTGKHGYSIAPTEKRGGTRFSVKKQPAAPVSPPPSGRIGTPKPTLQSYIISAEYAPKSREASG